MILPPFGLPDSPLAAQPTKFHAIRLDNDEPLANLVRSIPTTQKIHV